MHGPFERLTHASVIIALQAALLLPATASAGMVLKFHEGAFADLLIPDQSAGDLNPVVGAISTGPIAFGTYSIAFVNGFSKPVLPASGTEAHLQLSASAASSLASVFSVPMSISLNDSDFPATDEGLFRYDVVVTTTGTAFFSACKDLSNSEFLGSFCFLPQQFFGGTGSAESTHEPLPVYAMNMTASLQSKGVQTTNFSFAVDNVAVPEPASLALLGLGLVGLGFSRRKKS